MKGVKEMDPKMATALATAARAFADALDGAANGHLPVAGTGESMYVALREFARINDDHRRGVTLAEARDIALAAGMDARGLAGYYTAESGLLGKNSGGRWITKKGRARLKELDKRYGNGATP